MAKKRKFKASKLLVIIVAFIGLALAFNFVRQLQILISEAQVPQTVGEVVAKSQRMDNGLMKIDLYFRTGSNENNMEAMSYLSFRLKISSFLGIVDEGGVQTEEIFVEKSLRDSDNWEFPVNKVVVEETNTLIDFSAVNLTKEGFSTIIVTKLATFYIDTRVYIGEITINVDEDYSFIYSKDRPVTNIWKVPPKLPIN